VVGRGCAEDWRRHCAPAPGGLVKTGLLNSSVLTAYSHRNVPKVIHVTSF
jgi:hypothetical protein